MFGKNMLGWKCSWVVSSLHILRVKDFARYTPIVNGIITYKITKNLNIEIG